MRSGRTLVDFPIGWVRAYWNPFVIEYTLWIQAPLMWRLQSYLKIPNLIGKVQIYTTTSIVFLAEYLEWWICKEMMHLHSWNQCSSECGHLDAQVLLFLASAVTVRGPEVEIGFNSGMIAAYCWDLVKSWNIGRIDLGEWCGLFKC